MKEERHIIFSTELTYWLTQRLTQKQEIFKKEVSTLVCYNAKKIAIFGSYAYGTPGKESDIDILVIVKKSSLPRYKRSIPIYQELSGILVPKDLLVYTEDEIEEWSEVPQSFITTICKKGRVIYEKDKD